MTTNIEDDLEYLVPDPQTELERVLCCIVCHKQSRNSGLHCAPALELPVVPIRVPHIRLDQDCGCVMCSVCYQAWWTRRPTEQVAALQSFCPICRGACVQQPATMDNLLGKMLAQNQMRCRHCGHTDVRGEMLAHHRTCSARLLSDLQIGHNWDPTGGPICERKRPCQLRCRWVSVITDLLQTSTGV